MDPSASAQMAVERSCDNTDVNLEKKAEVHHMFDSTSLTQYFGRLLELDLQIAKIIEERGCPVCAGVLDASHYRRKPRGVESISDRESIRLSYCCREDGCRKRVTPPSLRFLARKVYWAGVVILSATVHWPELGLEVCQQTRARWRGFWARVFSGSAFAKSAKAGLSPGMDFSVDGILSGLGGVRQGFEDSFQNVLRFFTPLSTKALCRACLRHGHEICMQPDGA
jgi:hypothetical protein